MTNEKKRDETIEELEEALTESEKTTEYYMNRCRELEIATQELPVHDQDEAVEFIVKAMAADYPHLETMSAGDVRLILDYDEDYMRSKGIIEE